MTTITTLPNVIKIDNYLIQKATQEVTLLSDGVRLNNIFNNEYLELKSVDVTIDGTKVESKEALFDYFLKNCF